MKMAVAPFMLQQKISEPDGKPSSNSKGIGIEYQHGSN